jgi:hypothetical protein
MKDLFSCCLFGSSFITSPLCSLPLWSAIAQRDEKKGDIFRPSLTCGYSKSHQSHLILFSKTPWKRDFSHLSVMTLTLFSPDEISRFQF